MSKIQIDQVSPVAGALVGGNTITLTGVGFEKNAIVYFGSQLATETSFETVTTVKAVVPPAAASGSVPVTIVNPAGNQFTLEGGYTYVTAKDNDRAEVLGISPLTVIEGIETEVTLRGRHLKTAYDEGLLALRGPSRVILNISNVISSKEDDLGIESITFTVTVSAAPLLEPLERIAIQVLASRRNGAREDLVAESSKQMFTVLPSRFPVPIAYTPNLSTDKPSLVVILGRNLEGCSLELGDGSEVHLQRSDDRSLAGIVTIPDALKNSSSTEFSLIDKDGKQVGQYELSIAQSSSFKKSDPIPAEEELLFEGSPRKIEDSLATDLTIDFAAVSGQQFLGPQADDSVVYDLRGELQNSLNFIWINFEIVIADYYILLEIVNEVHLVPLFDGGGENLESPILAQVGKLFPVRGFGILIAARVEVIVRITVILIISIYIDIWPIEMFNEFPEQFPNAIGTVVVGIIVIFQVIFNISYLMALVRPNGTLRLIFVFQLTLGFDFTFSTDGRRLNFLPNFSHSVDYFGIFPFADQFPCNGQFQLAADNGQTVFTDAFGGQVSYYFPRTAGQCCVPWRFDLQLVSIRSDGHEEVVQPSFDAAMCLTATPNPNLMDVIIESVPPPQGLPPTLLMNIADIASLRALGVPVDENGNPTGEPPRDLVELGFEVDFFLETPLQVLDPTALTPGTAVAIQNGSNIIHAAVTSEPQIIDEDDFGFFFGTILSFNILRYLAEGQEPRFNAGGLPVTVNPLAGAVRVEPVLAYRDSQNVLREAPKFGTSSETYKIDRYEPFETQRDYTLAIRFLDIPESTQFPLTLHFTVNPANLKLFTSSIGGALSGSPIDPALFGSDRDSRVPREFFSGRLVDATTNTSVTQNITFEERPKLNNLFEIPEPYLKVEPNVIEADAIGGTPRQLVVPGRNVINKNVLLNIPLRCGPTNAVSLTRATLSLVVENDETFEEYLRVFKQVNTVLTDPGAGSYFSGFGNALLNALNNRGNTSVANVLIDYGRTLWETASALVQRVPNPYLDDRLLYWARLQGIGALRAYARRNPSSNALNDLPKLERTSRGLDPDDGGIKFTGAPVGVRRAIITGFDPFGLLRGGEKRSNPSGLIALSFDGTTITIPNHGDFYVRTAMFPVRFEDFNNRMVEDAINPSLGSIVILITTSQGSVGYYDVERWAGRNRAATLTDNNNKPAGVFPNDPEGPQFIESTLPYDLVITAPESLSGPMGPAAFVADQSYKLFAVVRDRSERRDGVPGDPPVVRHEFRPEPLITDEAGHQPVTDGPLGTSGEGSGGSYLSNEIFYRSALRRNAVRNRLPSGHFHVPPTGLNPLGSVGQGLINGVSQAFGRFFRHAFRFTGLISITFPPTVVNTNTERVLDVANNSTETLRIGTIDVAAPFSVVLPSPLPITVNAGASITLTVRFTPTSVGIQTGTLTLRESSGEILLNADLSGEGITSQPPPTISGFDPATVEPGGIVTVSGQYFTMTTEVKIGNYPVSYVVESDSQISVEAGLTGGFIKVVTLFGTVTSATILTVIFRPPDE